MSFSAFHNIIRKLNNLSNVLLSSHRQKIIPSPRLRNTSLFTIRMISECSVNTHLSKIDSPEFKKLFTPELKVLSDIFSKNGFELRIAGGAVRDLLLSKVPHDLDFASTATPSEMVSMFEQENIRMLNNKGEKHGTVTCRINDKENFEVTTLRVDIRTDGRHADVEFTKDWIKDAERRDLTINSMFLDFDGTLYDYFDGQKDLRERKVRFVGVPAARMKEDYLRILRYFRFYGRISPDPNKHELDTLQAIKENAEGLSDISGERIWVELKKIATGNYADSILKVMNDLGVLKHLGFTGDLRTDNLSDVWRKCHDLQPLPMTVISALLTTSEQLEMLHSRVKMSKDEYLLASFIIEHRSKEIFSSYAEMTNHHKEIISCTNASGESREAKKLKIEPDESLHLQPKDILTGSEQMIQFEGESKNDIEKQLIEYCQDLVVDSQQGTIKTHHRVLELLKYLNLRTIYNQFESWSPPRFPVNGKQLLELGAPRGPALKEELNILKELWKSSRFTRTEEELLQSWKSTQFRGNDTSNDSQQM